ncbi:MAG: hypothetical protein GY859_31260, partial [Desulfobacterales bacterium]|nr:hypothetical protein [Desulfobacterales bacterium]
VAGFIAVSSHYRLLGVAPSNVPTRQYLEWGGKCMGLIFQALVPGPGNLIWKINDPGTCIPDMDWGGAWLIAWCASAGLLALWAAARWRFYPAVGEKWKRVFNITALAGVLAMAGAMLSMETEILKINARLQPFTAADFGPVSSLYSPGRDDGDPDYEALQTRVKKTAGKLLKTAKGKKASRFDPLFSHEDKDGYGLQRLMTFFKIVWIASLTMALLFYLVRMVEGRVARVVKVAAAVSLASQMIFIPAAFGIMAQERLYPVARVVCKYDESVVTHFPVILLVDDDNKAVIYDRVNLMSIRHIPKSAVLSVEQFFLTSPFSNCSGDPDPEKFIPCELEAVHKSE